MQCSADNHYFLKIILHVDNGAFKIGAIAVSSIAENSAWNITMLTSRDKIYNYWTVLTMHRLHM
jgi:hypothetical protein